MHYPHLFQPIGLAGKEIPNRLCLTATLTNFGDNSQITEPWINFHAQRAHGGTGLIITEAVAVDADAVANPSVIAAFDPKNARGFRTLADDVHKAGSAVVAQLWHAGRQQLWAPTRSPQGVSDQPDAYSWTVPHVMIEAEINRVVASFIDVGVKMAEAGLDGVELHGAHGYLITQFLSPWSNNRKDGWGGGISQRTKFCLDIARGIREECGKDFIIGIKMPADEGIEGGIDPTEAALITTTLKQHNLFDYFSYSQGNFSLSLENHVPDMHFSQGHFLDLHRSLHQAADGTPIMALGRIDTPELADRVVAEGYGELVGMCRALVSDAAFGRKARTGNTASIRPSLYDNFCWGVIHTGRSIAEPQNPQLATRDEATWSPGTTHQTQRIAVIGSGPAGLEAAWLSAARGHDVTLFTKNSRLGGKLALEANLPGHTGVQDLINYQKRLCEQHGVIVRTETGTLESMLADNYDHVIVATGSTMRQPTEIEGDLNRLISLYDFASSLENDDPTQHAPKPGTAIMFDHDHTPPVYSAVDALCADYERVVLVTPRTNIAQPVNYCSALGIHRRLHSRGVEIMTAMQPVSIDGDDVTLRNVFSQNIDVIENCEIVVYATPRKANAGLTPDNDSDGLTTTYHHIGDCASPRNLLIAIHEAHAVAGQI